MTIEGVMLDVDTLAPDDLDLSSLYALDVKWRSYGNSTASQVAGRIGDASVVLTNKAPVSDEIMQQSPALKYIGVLATGTNVIDIEAAQRLGVTVTNVTGYGNAAVAQHTLALMLALATRLPDYQRAAQDGRWRSADNFCLLDYPILELAGKTLGIVGYGTLGQTVARLARALGMDVMIAALPGRHEHDSTRIRFEELLAAVDMLSLHCPLAENTRNLIDRDALAQMKPTALLINCARGGIVDEAALADALRHGRLGGAGVDVLTEEPPRNGNPLLNPDIPNLIVTPHCAWGSRESRQRLVEMAAENLRSFLAGNPVSTVLP